MSRTYRRKQSKCRLERWNDGWFYSAINWRYTYWLKDDEPQSWRAKADARYHSDAGTVGHIAAPKPFRREQQKKHRVDARRQLHNSATQDEYEVQLRSKPRLPWWD